MWSRTSNYLLISFLRVWTLVHNSDYGYHYFDSRGWELLLISFCITYFSVLRRLGDSGLMLNYSQTNNLLRITISSLTGRYVAPEVFKNEEYDTRVDVFSFALILQEVIPR